ncbi:MAG TPA: hypothetical protein VF618_21390 [Thermoanaerobaculia bacterium]
MRHTTTAFAIAALLITSVMFAASPSDADVLAVYNAVRTEVCTGAGVTPCPPAFDKPEQQRYFVTRYCAINAGSPACATVPAWPTIPTLELDHVTRTWTVTGGLADRTERDINGIPTVSLARDEQIITVVVNTNPLLYGASAGEIKQENIEQLADLQKLAGLLGTTFAAVLPGAAVAASDHPFEVAAKNVIRDVGSTIPDAQCLGDALTRQAFEISSFIQSVEVNRQAEYVVTPPDCGGRALTPQNIRDITAQTFGVSAVAKSFCPAAIDAAVALLEGDESTIDAAVQAYFDAAASIHCVRFGTPLIDDQGGQITPLKSTLERRVINRIRNTPTDGRKAILKTVKDEDLAALKRLKNVLSMSIDASGKLITASAAMNKAALQVERFRVRLLQNVLRPPHPCGAAPALRCSGQEDVARFIVIPNNASNLRWDKINPQPIKVAADSPFAADVVPSRPATVETSFRAKAVGSRAWDLGVAVTATRLKSPTFGVQDGAIAIADEESRAGNLAMMFNYLPFRIATPNAPEYLQRLGAQVGAAVDTKKPAFFWGISYGLGPYIRLGWGGTSQRITELRGQSIGDPVPNKEAIRTRQGFANSHYWSLTVSINSLKFFTN